MDSRNKKGDAVFTDIDEVLAKKILRRSQANNSDHSDPSYCKQKQRTSSKKGLWRVSLLVVALLIMVAAVYRIFRANPR